MIEDADRDSFIASVDTTLKEAQCRACLSWDSVQQSDTLRHLQQIGEVIEQRRQRVAQLNDESAANECLALRCLCAAMECELRMWVAVKTLDFSLAWNELVVARQSAIAAIHAHSIGASMERRLALYDLLEEVLFPPQLFSSIGCLSLEEKCSICDAPYGDCSHVAGRPYMGQFCSRVITKSHLLEVSIVLDPEDRRCRVTSFAGEDGIERDTLTKKPVGRSSKGADSLGTSTTPASLPTLPPDS